MKNFEESKLNDLSSCIVGGENTCTEWSNADGGSGEDFYDANGELIKKEK